MTLPIHLHLVNFAVANAARQTSREDTAAAILSALRGIRSAVRDRDDFASLCALDDGIRDHVLAQHLRQRRFGGADRPAQALPQPSLTRNRRVATAILDEAVSFIMAANGPVPAGLLAGEVVHGLLGHLTACLGGPPCAEDLLAALRGPEDGRVEPGEAERPDIARVH
ncbi:hypothetical protein [Azospirillum rugosum]|uniref:Uncharacterized protein n=1 Tax=Azospirillum rugosum TaxID=416170 RepID=A0ABS4SPC7_9PROT|nr:hypothetical protein [Azospirillum rugosum]MBP2294342.1 hypothetical protein [Azospirillum rugosum]MDQ0527677.1 hypothetical protein [Azospirillum rugosum]